MNSLRKPLLIIGLYLGWNALFTLLLLSVMTYFLARAGVSFADLSDTVATNRVIIMGVGATLLGIFICQLNPIYHIAREELIHANRIEQEWFPAFVRGGILACTVVLIFLLFRHYRYVGFFVHNESPLVATAGLIIRALAILVMVYLDEFFFRQRLSDAFLSTGMHPLRAITLCAFIYALGKSFQFSLGVSQLLTLTLLGLSLNLRTFNRHPFAAGAGLFGGFLTVIHCVFSIPILGNDAQGFLLLRYQFRFESGGEWVRILTGGAGGLLSSAALQLFLLSDILFQFHSGKKTLWPHSGTNVR